MLHLSRHTVRHGAAPYLGSGLAVLLGVMLISMTVTMVHAVGEATERPGTGAVTRAQLEGLSAMFGIMSSIALFMALFVVGSTFGFVVATRRRELGLLRLVGATPRQVRRLVLGESLVVAVVASVLGAVLAAASAPVALWLLHERGITPMRLEAPTPWVAAAVAVPSGVVVALLGSWRSSRRAARVSPVAALVEASVERRRVSLGQWLVGSVCLGGSLVGLVLAARLDLLFALIASVLLPEVLVVGLTCFGAVLFPALGRLLARPFVDRHVAARLARDQLRSAPRTTASTAAPLLAISAIAGSLILALSFTADWTTGLNRQQLAADLVVDPGEGAVDVAGLRALPDVAVVDQRLVAPAGFGAAGEAARVEGIDRDATATRGLTASRGDLDTLWADRPALAVSETWTTDSGVGLGDRVRLRLGGTTLRLRVGAVVPDAPDLHEDLIVAASVLEEYASRTRRGEVFVLFDDGADPVAARAAVEGATGASAVRSAAQWIDDTDRVTRQGNELGLWVLLGPSGAYAGIAVVNTILVGAMARRRELAVVCLVGATREQLRRAALWEAGLVGAAALLVGSAIAGSLGWSVRRAIDRDVVQAPMTMPWLPLAAIALTGIALVLVAAVVGSWAAVRRADPVQLAR